MSTQREGLLCFYFLPARGDDLYLSITDQCVELGLIGAFLIIRWTFISSDLNHELMQSQTQELK